MRTIGTSNGPAGMIAYSQCDMWVTRDNKITMRLDRKALEVRNGQSDKTKAMIVVEGDEDLLLDMAAQLLGAAQMIRERKRLGT